MDISLLMDSSRSINIATVILATLAGLYGFNTILGQRGGLLRQLVVAIPGAVLSGVAGYIADILTHHLFSTIFLTAFPIALPSNVDPAYLYAVYSAILVTLMILTAPNMYRVSYLLKDQEQGVQYPISFMIAMGITLGTFTYASLVYLDVNGRLPFNLHPSREALIIFTLVLILLLFFMFMLTRVNTDSDHSGAVWVVMGLGCLGSVVYVVFGIGLAVLFASLVGWAYLFAILAFFVPYIVILILQAIADALPQEKLLFVALFFFLCAAGLQLYQAIAL